MPASSGQQPKSSMPPKHTISGLKSPDDNPEPGLARFGPVYGEDTEANVKAKDSAWKHILEKSGVDEAERVYMRSIADIEQQALDSYDRAVVEKLKLKRGKEFRRMMVRDGCFFLQLSLHVLGAAELLDYSEQNPYFRKGSDSSSWIPAMFFVGNQIPCAVIRALMKQDFFKNVIDGGSKTGMWQRQRQRWTDEKDLTKLVLYQMVVEPELEKRVGFFSKSRHESRESAPSNILHALHSSLLGPGDNDPIYSEMKEFHDLEDGREDSDVKIPSAGELHKLGITLRKAKSNGITNIHFQNRVFWARLELPPLTIDSHTKDLLTSLAKHEQNLSESDREVTAYLRFMRDLAPTYKDFKILEKKGIIHVKDEELKRNMVHMLDNIVTTHKSSFTLNFRQTRRKITGYGGPPWRLISIALAVLTIVQTIFTVLSYFIPRK
ncbi:hypothetical protein C2S53_019816 [Perilla frutescens var. hirtella]|uniref:Uncharacterized protein n=1 Tax=Perilla frutescens var. hirtella TaxID=608512 RepID=A0AAD4JIV0_PERFH|nr:hypothetical protein C2S53_019816 [Perilla frutescens var. hirtella]